MAAGRVIVSGKARGMGRVRAATKAVSCLARLDLIEPAEAVTIVNRALAHVRMEVLCNGRVTSTFDPEFRVVEVPK